MQGRTVSLICAVLALGACGEAGQPLPSEAFCDDVKDGLNVMNLIGDADPREFADDAYGMMAISCPEELEGWRAYFERWDINIDA